MHEPHKVLGFIQLGQRIPGEAHGKAAKEDPLTDVAGRYLATTVVKVGTAQDAAMRSTEKKDANYPGCLESQ